MLTLMVLVMMSCSRGSFSVVNGVELNTETRFSMTYDRLNGFKEKDVVVESGESVEILVSFVSISGELDASICLKNDEETCSYEGNDVPSTSFTVTLSEPGTYVIRVEADRHSGNYSFSW